MLDTLPTEIIEMIISQVGQPRKMALVCSKFRDIVDNNPKSFKALNYFKDYCWNVKTRRKVQTLRIYQTTIRNIKNLQLEYVETLDLKLTTLNAKTFFELLDLLPNLREIIFYKTNIWSFKRHNINYFKVHLPMLASINYTSSGYGSAHINTKRAIDVIMSNNGRHILLDSRYGSSRRTRRRTRRKNQRLIPRRVRRIMRRNKLFFIR